MMANPARLTTDKGAYIATRRSPTGETWMRPEVEARLPAVNESFSNAHTKQPAAEPAKMQGSTMVEQDKPVPVLKPSPELAATTDAQHFNQRWRSEIERSVEILKDDKRQLSAAKDGFNQLNERIEGMKFKPDGAAIQDAERELYVKERQADAMRMRSAQHIRKTHQLTGL